MKRARPSHRGLLRHKNEQLVPTASGPLRLWIRADNLSPLQVAEGEARLTNDLTVLSLEERKSKRVANWSLHLRHRERAAIVLLGESRASLEEAEHEKSQEHLENMSTEEWDELEEASKRASNWMSREETSLTFDTKIDVDKKMTFEKDYESQVHRFNVVVPAVAFPASRLYPMSGRGMTYLPGMSGIQAAPRKEWVSPASVLQDEEFKYNGESEFSYYAKVRFVDGTIVEVPGGRSSFVPKPMEVMPMEVWTTSVHFIKPKAVQNHNSLCLPIFNQDDGLTEARDQGYELNAILDLPSGGFAPNHTHTIKGNFLNSLDMDKLLPLKVRMSTFTVIKRHWMKDMMQDHRPDLKYKVDEELQSRKAFPRYVAPTSSPSVGKMLQYELSLLHKLDNGHPLQDDEWNAGLQKGHWEGFKVDQDLQSFTASIYIKEDELASDVGAFESVETSLKIGLDTSRRLESDSDEPPKSTPHDPSQIEDHDADWKADWQRSSNLARHLEESRRDPTPRWGPTLKALVSIKVLGSARPMAPKKDLKLQEALQKFRQEKDRQTHHYLSPVARGPVLVSFDDSQQLIETLEDEDNFPLISSTRVVNVNTQEAGQKEKPTDFVPLRFLEPRSYGSASEDVGAIWAKKVLLPLHSDHHKIGRLKGEL